MGLVHGRSRHTRQRRRFRAVVCASCARHPDTVFISEETSVAGKWQNRLLHSLALDAPMTRWRLMLGVDGLLLLAGCARGHAPMSRLIAAWKAGKFPNPDESPEVMQLVVLLPLAA